MIQHFLILVGDNEGFGLANGLFKEHGFLYLTLANTGSYAALAVKYYKHRVYLKVSGWNAR